MVKYLEKLVLIRFSDDEKKKLVVEIEKIVSLFNEIMAVEGLDNYEPLYYVHDVEGFMRDDEVIGALDTTRENLSNAELVNGFVKAPRTVVE
ncbi:Glu-tRNAGln amidotransferase C subunit [Ignisphaera aggregans DSM 17230]|uniref:Glu-tRNAGln amidotransferase C subunit n=1 Tax=Ignisphaera aggregans (strain DSM 17230 / JCM 13409 / AQ1.S1) TaxID=583356 RepID=E0SNS4_IGNAA|nr:Glu-tRNAGln amidotransferase C subunit [Ignisphaera aggregans DSM 17230]